MKPTRTHLMRAAAALSTIVIAMSTAGAATAAVDPVAGQAATLTGSTYITTAPTTFTNTNNQVSAGNNSVGDQIAK